MPIYKQPNFKHPWKSSRGGIVWECLVQDGDRTIVAKVEKRLTGWLLSIMIDSEIPDLIADDDRTTRLHETWDDGKLAGEEIIDELLAESASAPPSPAPAPAPALVFDGDDSDADDVRPDIPARPAKLGCYYDTKYDTKIDPEIERLIPPLTPDERDGLEGSLLEDGCRDALVVWKETGIVLDGHNRLRLCTQHGIDYDVSEKSFEDRDSAKQWVMRHQLSRRNLSDSQRAMLASMVWKRVPGNPSGVRDGSGQFAKKPNETRLCKFAQSDTSSTKSPASANSATPQTDPNTREYLSETHNISPRTLGHARKVKEKGVQELKEAVLQGTVAVSAAAAVADLPEEQQREVVQAGPKAVKQAASQARAKTMGLPDVTIQIPMPPVKPPAVTPAPVYSGQPFTDGLDDEEPGLLNRVCDVIEDAERVAKEAVELLNLHESPEYLIILTGMMMMEQAWGRLENEGSQDNARKNITRFLDRYGNPGAVALYLNDDGE